MKTSRGAALTLAILLTGCGRQNNTPAPPANAATPPADAGSGGYLGALASGQKKAVAVVDVASLNQAIQIFNAQEGRFPKDLQELVTARMIREIPAAPNGMKLDYDAAAGTVKVSPQ